MSGHALITLRLPSGEVRQVPENALALAAGVGPRQLRKALDELTRAGLLVEGADGVLDVRSTVLGQKLAAAEEDPEAVP